MLQRYDLANGESPEFAEPEVEKRRRSYNLPSWMDEVLDNMNEKKSHVVERALYGFLEERGLIPEEVARR